MCESRALVIKIESKVYKRKLYTTTVNTLTVIKLSRNWSVREFWTSKALLLAKSANPLSEKGCSLQNQATLDGSLSVERVGENRCC